MAQLDNSTPVATIVAPETFTANQQVFHELRPSFGGPGLNPTKSVWDLSLGPAGLLSRVLAGLPSSPSVPVVGSGTQGLDSADQSGGLLLAGQQRQRHGADAHGHGVASLQRVPLRSPVLLTARRPQGLEAFTHQRLGFGLSLVFPGGGRTPSPTAHLEVPPHGRFCVFP